MDTDLVLVIGIILCGLAIPALLAGFAESQSPRSGAVMFLIGILMAITAVTQKTSGYTFEEIPRVFVKVFSGLMN